MDDEGTGMNVKYPIKIQIKAPSACGLRAAAAAEVQHSTWRKAMLDG